MAEKHPKSLVLEGEVLNLWEDAWKAFLCALEKQDNIVREKHRRSFFGKKSGVEKDAVTKPSLATQFEESMVDLTAWLQTFKEKRHPKDNFNKACQRVGSHLNKIQAATRFIGFAINIASAVRCFP